MNVTDNPKENRFELDVDGVLAIAEYRVGHGHIVLTHTEVPEELSGRGVGSKLAKGVFEALRGSGRKAVLECSFMANYAQRHPEFEDIVAR
jgi:predicted GNAT family acetyltransferase